ncbi:DUF5672 family protein [Pedobacter aquatilis]|uniref:DUF5672 family protein n=1 Tax=Pedobacter aquatilis TaxID=351343 RepID=UPI00292DEB12|nr:DUF5672 family protein [Pedobacter aquatilis]
MSNQNIVIVPLYKSELNKYEVISLTQCFSIFKEKTIIAVKPTNLDISSISINFPFNKVISFDHRFFESIHGYNELMLSAYFYKEFLSYNFMLIYQLDTFAFADKLDYWSSQGYDYIGAPWIKPLKNNNKINQFIYNLKSYLYTKFNITRDGLPKSKQFYNKTGNGGFSLRNIELFYKLAVKEANLAQQYINLKNLAFNEDLFWSIEVNRKEKRIQIPDYKTSLKFSIESFPEFGYEINGKTLPFGCHAWEKHLDFWKDKIEAFGYIL